MPDKLSQSDHDLLIRIDTKMDRSEKDIKELDGKIGEVGHQLGVLNETMETKIAAAVSGKADTARMLELKADSDKKLEDHERRLRRLEKYTWTAIGALAVLQIIIAAAGKL